jgi:MYXO-CTERM domain-containing protein
VNEPVRGTGDIPRIVRGARRSLDARLSCVHAKPMNLRALASIALGLALATVGCADPDPALSSQRQPLSTGLVIRQIYAGGTGAPVGVDYVELYNSGTTPVSLEGKTLFHASATGAFWSKLSLTKADAGGARIEPKRSYLIELSRIEGARLGTEVDHVSERLDLEASGGKLALVDGEQAPACGAGPSCADGKVIDFVGWGSADRWEGSGAAPAMRPNQALTRVTVGCVDRDDNATDFALVADFEEVARPRNSLLEGRACGPLASDAGDAADADDADDAEDADDDSGDVGETDGEVDADEVADTETGDADAGDADAGETSDAAVPIYLGESGGCGCSVPRPIAGPSKLAVIALAVAMALSRRARRDPSTR